MTKSADNVKSEKPLLVFPPYMSRFLWVTLLSMMAHGVSIPIAAIYLAGISSKWAVSITVVSVLFFVVFNILVTRGINTGIWGLKLLLGFYLAVSLACLLFSNVGILCLVAGGSALLGLITMHGDKYREMFRYMQNARALRKAGVNGGSLY